MFKILKLTVWHGDHFNESFCYKEVGFTTDERLIERLKTIRVCISSETEWPLFHMNGWNVFKLEKVSLIDDNSFKSFEVKVE